MSNSPFDRMTANQLERPLSSDINLLESEIYRTLQDLAARAYGGRASYLAQSASDAFAAQNGFIGDSFMVTQPSVAGMNIVLRPGFGFYNNPTDTPVNVGNPSITGVNDLSPYKPIYLNQTLTLPILSAPPAGQWRVDLVAVAYDRYLTDQTVRDILNVTLKQFLGQSVYKTLSFDITTLVNAGVVSPWTTGLQPISILQGVPVPNSGGTTWPAALSTVAPAVPAGYLAIGYVVVFGSGVSDGPTTAIAQENIADLRQLLFQNNQGNINGLITIDPTASGVAVTSAKISAPPGIDVVVLGPTGTFNGTPGTPITIFALMGASPAFATIGTPTVQNTSGTGSGIFIANMAKRTLTAADQSAINTARSSDTQKYAVGQNALVATIETFGDIGLSGSNYVTAAFANPLSLQFNINFGY